LKVSASKSATSPSCNIDELIAIRRDLHSNPERSGEEQQTAERIIEVLKVCSPDSIQTRLGGFGVLAQWDSGNAGPHLLFRAELDALPIEEQSEKAWVSRNTGIAHVCGHDGHATILLGLAKNLDSAGIAKGKVSILFQPSEENGEGAHAVLNDSRFSSIKPDFVLALHNLPGYALGKWVLRQGVFSAEVISVIFTFTGKTAHAGEPENGVNPASALSSTLLKALAFEQPDFQKEDYTQITPVHILLGSEDYGISAGKGSLHLTLRCWDKSRLQKTCRHLEMIAREEAGKSEVKVSFEYLQQFDANVNSDDRVESLRELMESTGRSFTFRDFPFRWGEDFGAFTQQFGGVMLGLGSGENQPALHNPDFDFPDDLLTEAVGFWTAVVNHWNR
jgi:amidohydrolase